jgi:carbon-monoxide dehydrogenase small subunit
MAVNGQPVRAEIDARTTLLEFLRRAGFVGAREGCGSGDCGACTVLLDGRPVCSCLTLALRAQGRGVQTAEGLGAREARPIPAAFAATQAFACGFCLPGMQLCAKALLEAVPHPSEAEVREALGGCLCRCTGYAGPVAATLRAAGGEEG